MKPENKQPCIDVLSTEPVQTAEMMKGDVPNNASPFHVVSKIMKLFKQMQKPYHSNLFLNKIFYFCPHSFSPSVEAKKCCHKARTENALGHRVIYACCHAV